MSQAEEVNFQKSNQVDNSEVSVDINLREIWLLSRRYANLVGGIIVFSLVLAIIFLVVSTPLYTSKAVLQVNLQKNHVIDIESVMSGITSDEGQIQSQLDIISSRSLAGKVVDKLDLVNDPEFSPEVRREGILSSVMELMGKAKQPVDLNDKESRIIRSKTITKVLERLKVHRNPRSYTIVVKFISQSPKKAALIANTFVSEHIKSQLDVKFEATKSANVWLNNKLGDLQEKVRQSEMLVQAFRQKHGLIESSGRTINDQQLSELNTQLILARTERAQAEAKLSGAGSKDSSADVLRSPLIQSLRGQETEVLRKKSDLSSQYGPKHPKIINVNAELRDLRRTIQIEIDKIKSSLENEVKIAIAREESLKKSLDELTDKVGLTEKSRIELSELERQNNANRSIYESFLERSKETLQGQGLERSDLLIISSAEEPFKPSYPRKFVILFIALLCGFGVSVLVIIVLEHLDDEITSSKQVADITGLKLIEMIPELSKGVNFINHIIKKPSSVFAEALRSVITAIYFSDKNKDSKVIMITSSVPKEGKSSFAISLSSLISNSGKKTLLIDADMKRPSIARTLKKEFKFGLSDVLEGRAKKEDIICREENAGIDFIPSHPNTVNSHGLLGSEQMKNFISEARKEYDLIIIDTPPVMALSDCIGLTKMVDTTIFVIRWQKTKIDTVKSAIKQLKSFDVNIAGVVLTRVDMKKQSKYSGSDKGYYYTNYSEYYSG